MKISKDFNELNAMETYFLYLEEDNFIKAMEDFSRKIGYGISEFICCAFASEYETWEEGYFGEGGIKFEVEPPAVDEVKYEIVCESDFIKFIDKMIQEYLVTSPSNEVTVRRLIKKIRTNLLETS